MEQKSIFSSVREGIVSKIIPQEKKNNLDILLSDINNRGCFLKLHEKAYDLGYGILIETIITEFKQLKKDGKLSGSSHKERVCQFESIINDHNFLVKFEQKYPIIIDITKRKLNDYYFYLIEIISYYMRDSKQIDKKFDNSFGQILDIHLSQGDNHSGKSVAIIECENGSLVYKPRSFSTDMLVKKLLDKLVEYDNTIECKMPKFLSFDDHSWQECINPNECVNMEEVHRYYKRIGIYLAIFFILSSNDMHYENLIACGEYPMFIDMETITNGRRGEKENIHFYRTLPDSVLYSSILPVQGDQRIFDMNMSAIFTGKQVSKVNYGYMIDEDEEKDWIYKRVQAAVVPLDNIVKCNGQEVGPQYVEADIITGFESAISCIQKNKDKFVDEIESVPVNSIEIRQLLRPTAVYGKFLYASISPKYTCSRQKYDDLFDILIKQFTRTDFGYLRVLREIEDLKKGYVPKFYSLFDELHLYSDGDIVCENYFLESNRDTIINKIQAIDDSLIYDQIRYIKMAFLSLYGPSDRIMSQNKVASKSYLATQNIASMLKDYTAELNKSIIKYPQDAYAITMPCVGEDGFAISTLNSEFYDFGGLIWYLAVYGSTFDQEVSDLAEKLYKSFYLTYEEQNKTSTAEKNYSVFCGIGSILYLTTNFYNLYEKKEYLDIYNKELPKLIEAILNDGFKREESLDFLTGLSSSVFLLCKLCQEFKNEDAEIYMPQIFEIAMLYSDAVDKAGKFEYGLAHGVAGIALALSSLYTLTKEKKYFQQLEKLLSLEKNMEHDYENMTWCHGDAGVRLVHAIICKTIPELIPIINDQIINDELLSKYLSYDQMCLCHGKYGNIDVLINLTNIPGKLLYKKWFEKLQNLRFFESTDYSYESFMLGTSGIAYVMMRLLNPELPSVLALDLYHK